LVAKLPFENYSLLRALTSHLIIVVDNAAINKMTVRNVGIVFSPTLGIPAGVFSLMLTEFNKVFGVESDGSDAEDAPVEKPPQPRPHRRTAGGDRRNSRGYNESDADRLLGLGGRKLTGEVL
jgi:RalA-binding protein 1